ncbi:YegP family protein [Methylophilus sp.]|uniref:YegP family protein n=1 Tax=Methylophilus sp. TaxID=29541 RepID=UPI0040364050
MAGWFELTKSAANGQFGFALKAGNGEQILRSEQYTTKAAAQNGIESVQKNSAVDERYQKLVARDGSPYFNLLAANSQIIGTSQMYSSEAGRDNGIASVKNNGSSATIKDLT